MKIIRAIGIVLTLVVLSACEPPPADRIIGDSNTYGNSWATKLGNNCTPDIWAWGGVGVYWGSAGLSSGIHLKRDYVSMAGTTGEHVVVMLGTNDAIHTNFVPTTAQLNQLADRMTRNGDVGSVRWATIPPIAKTMPLAARWRLIAWNEAILGTPNAVDLRSALGDELKAAHRTDQIHLNNEGHGRLAWVASQTSICG